MSRGFSDFSGTRIGLGYGNQTGQGGVCLPEGGCWFGLGQGQLQCPLQGLVLRLEQEEEEEESGNAWLGFHNNKSMQRLSLASITITC